MKAGIVIFVLAGLLMMGLIVDANTNCICPSILDPVCGADGITYDSLCDMQCAGVELQYQGSCSGDSQPPLLSNNNNGDSESSSSED